MTRIVVLGSTGQVGRAVLALLGPRGQGFSRADADLGKPETLASALDLACGRENPEGMFNCAAYTAVDQAEVEPELAATINAISPGEIARWCARRSVPVVHFSTDYVFPAEGSRPWTEDDPTGPLSAYGRTKLEGERQVEAAGGRYLILRTSWVYAHAGHNFVNTMLRLGREREKLRVVADQAGAPTYAPDLARATLEAFETARSLPVFPCGIYHLCGSGETTWDVFARAIFDRARTAGVLLRVTEVEAISTEEYLTPARRPLNSRLNTEKARRMLGVTLPNWESSLDHCIQLLKP